MSPFLKATLARATDYAAQQTHREVTLEHLLLALAEDPDAGPVLKLSNVEIGRLMSDVSGYLGLLDDRVEPGHGQPAGSISGDLKRILEAAAAAAQQGRRREINGAIVLAAIVGDGRTPSAHMLRSQGLTFEAAIRALQRMAAQGPASPHGSAQAQLPAPPSEARPGDGQQRALPPRATTADDLLASARERVRTRGLEPAAVTPAGERPMAVPGSPSLEPMAPSGGLGTAAEELTRPSVHPAPDLRAQPFPSAAPAAQSAPQPAGPGPGLSLDDAVATIRRDRAEATAGTMPAAQPASLPAPLPSSAVTPQWEPVSRPGPHPAPHPAPLPGAGASFPPPQAAPPPGPGSQSAAPPSWMPAPAPNAPPAGVPPMGRAPAPMQPTPRPALPAGAPARPAPPPPWQYGAPDQRQGFPDRGGHPPYPQHDEALARLDARRPPPSGPMPGQGAARAPAEGQAGPARPAIEPGQLHETLPRKMRVGVAVACEVLIARAEVKNVAERLQAGGAAYRHEISVTRAMTVRLRAPDGGFIIETTSPETQWIENILNLAEGDSARWRWMVTARERGKKRLQLVVSARTVDGEGLTAETALPDKIIDVKVSINYGETAKRWAGWITAAVLGGVLARFGDTAYEVVNSLMSRSGG